MAFRGNFSCAAFCAALIAAGSARANGEAEYVAPLDRPVAAHPQRPLPFPVVEEPAPRGTPSIAIEPLPADFVFLTTPSFAATRHDNAVGQQRECFESVVIRSSQVARGKFTIVAGGLGYVTEAWPGALPLRQDVVCLAGVPHTLVDLEQSIVTRKSVTLGLGEASVLGSDVFRFRSITELGDLKSAVIDVTALSGFDWARLGSGSLEVSTTKPGWHARTFHYGLHQGRVEEVTEKSVRFGWLSGVRTDSVLLAAKREFAGKVAAGEAPVDGSGIKIVRVDPGARQVDVETPDGMKTLTGAGDQRGLPADTAARKRLIAAGAKYAVVLVPEASDFAGRKAHVEIYSGLRRLRHGDASTGDRAFKPFPIAHYNGAVLGVYWVNDQALELSPSAPVLEGPSGAFKLSSSWSESGELETIELVDRSGAKSAGLPVAGRKSIHLLAGAGPTVDALLGRVGSGTAAALHELWSAASRKPAVAKAAPVPPKLEEPPLTRADLFRPERMRAALPWALFSAAIGLTVGFGLGRIGRRRASTWD